MSMGDTVIAVALGILLAQFLTWLSMASLGMTLGFISLVYEKIRRKGP